jgi:hypothetical protein
MINVRAIALFVAGLAAMILVGCVANDSTESKQSQRVQQQQSQYNIGQPVPVYNWSLERHLLIQLYNIRNQKAATHAIWRSNYGQVEGDCPSMGYGLPYDTSLTNPLMSTDEDQTGARNPALTSIGQAEPNGVFASTNTSATWVMCTGKGGSIEPIYVESKVTIYPYPISVDYATGRVTKAGHASVSINGLK